MVGYPEAVGREQREERNEIIVKNHTHHANSVKNPWKPIYYANSYSKNAAKRYRNAHTLRP